MCGFIGGTEPEWRYAEALETLVHRGPDASGLLLDGPVRVGFRRLSIIDLGEEANQPMWSPDGRTWIVFNGEIYGFSRLRRELESRGHAFRTRSDTEVALEAYLEWGEDFIDRIDGMFAIAICNAATQTLVLYRDRAGIKPLYYYFDGRRFAFASELKALERAIGADSLEVDGTALYDFLGYRYVPAPKTLYKHCFKLPPAHRLEFDVRSRKIRGPNPFWRLPIPDAPAELSLEESCEALRTLVDRSVRDQMIADVPLGFFLSGGVDSSAVVASAAGTGSEVSTFSIGFDSDENSETPFAREVAEAFHTDHHERILSQSHAQELLPSLKTWFDEPFADESAMPTFLVSKVARERVTVVLTGDGGDEVFGGYRTYPRFERYAAWPTAPRAVHALFNALRAPFGHGRALARVLSLLEMGFSDGPALWALIMAGMSTPAKRKYRRAFEIPDDYEDWWHYEAFWREELPARTRLQYVDFHTFLPGLVLTKVDRTSMAVSLEARVPLLAREITEFAFSLPEGIRYHGGGPKGLLRHAYRGILSDRILDRRKKGFGIPRYYLKDLASGKLIQEHLLETLFIQSTGHGS